MIYAPVEALWSKKIDRLIKEKGIWEISQDCYFEYYNRLLVCDGRLYVLCRFTEEDIGTYSLYIEKKPRLESSGANIYLVKSEKDTLNFINGI